MLGQEQKGELMSDMPDFMKEMFGSVGMDNDSYFCNKCGKQMDKIPVKTTLQIVRKLFYCKNPKCERFGLLTVVARKS